MSLLPFALGALLVAALVWARARFAAFPAQRPAEYAGTAPAFDIREQLNGRLACEGVIHGPTGRVASRFTAVFHARWQGDTGTMTERFTYDSGATQEREWTLQVEPGGRLRATAADVIGTGRGHQQGAAVSLRYRIRLPADAGGHVLDTTDWMYLIADGNIVNRSQFRKFGILVAELVATIRRVDEAPEGLEEAGPLRGGTA